MIKIRIHQEKDIPYRIKWLNNPNVNKFIGDKLGQKTNLKKKRNGLFIIKKLKIKSFLLFVITLNQLDLLDYQTLANNIKMQICLLQLEKMNIVVKE